MKKFITNLLIIVIIGAGYVITKSLDKKQVIINFTEEEKQWIKENPVIRVANEMDWPPFDFNEAGKPKGFSIDYLNLISDKIGFELDFVSGYSWRELIELFKNKDIDVMPVFFKTKERESFTLYTESYYRVKLGVFVNSHDSNIDINSDNLIVGIESSHGSIPFIIKKYPNITLIEMDYKDDLVKSLAVGKIDAIIGNPFVFYYLARNNQIEKIRLNNFIEMNEEEQSKTAFHIGVRDDLPILHRIIEKGMNAVTAEELKVIQDKWADISLVHKINWLHVSQFLFIIGLVFLFLIWNNHILKKMVSNKTKELKRLNENLEHIVEVRTQELIKLNKELEHIAHRDPLTNIYNRRYFFEKAKLLFSLAQRHHSEVALAMIDIDYFKKINDNYGHDVGDQVIKSFALEINNLIRDSDLFARFGGEEFIIILPSTSLDGALLVMEKIRNDIEYFSIENKMKFTISIGVTLIKQEDTGIGTTINRADRALYKAKSNGRNRVEFEI